MADANRDDAVDAADLIEAVNHRNLARLQELFRNSGASIHIQDNEGHVPLHYASENGHVGMAKLLIENGACVNSQSNIAWTALHFACAKGRLEVVKLLLRNGADLALETTDEGLSPLDLACRNNHSNVVYWMLCHFPCLVSELIQA